MKKTVSVNIKGINFVMEEDAFETLQKYLDRLKSNLGNQEGADEIIEDIEIRIAELCGKELSDKKTVVELQDIQRILETLGDPDMYLDEEAEAESSERKQYSQHTNNSTGNDKRLYRDVDNAQIAGVCSGIANFLNIDVLLVRIIWLLIFFFGGFGLLLYLILWVIIPKANSSIDRLRMKGKPITVENVREEVERAAEKLTDTSRKFAGSLRKEDSYNKHFTTLGRAISVAFGIIALLIGLGFLISFVVFIVGGFQFIPAKTDTGFLSLTDLGDLVLASPADTGTAWIGGLLVSISTIAFLFLMGFMFLFNVKNKWAKRSLLGLFLVGLTGAIICISLGIKAGRDTAIREELEINRYDVAAEQLVIEPQLKNLAPGKNYKVKSHNSRWFMDMKGDYIYESGIHFRYRESADSLFHIYKSVEAHGYTTTVARTRAEHIRHNLLLSGDTLKIDAEYSYPKKDKLRFQDVDILIEIPRDKSVLIDGNIIRLGDDHSDEDESDYKREYGRLYSDGDYDHYD